jgi:hypothetical protein
MDILEQDIMKAAIQFTTFHQSQTAQRGSHLHQTVAQVLQMK